MTAADWGAAAVRSAPGFSEATDVVELGAGDFSRSLALAEQFGAKHFLSTDYVFSGRATANLPLAEALPNVDVGHLDARNVELPPRSVDFVFSIALMEHVAEIESCLESIARALRPGGVYYFIQAPFWSCAQGHHFRHSDDSTYDYIPKYSHLTHDRDRFEAMLRAGPTPPWDIEACTRGIYGRSDLSRIGRDETRRRVTAGPLIVESWTEKRDSRYDEALAIAALPDLRVPSTLEEMAISGATVVLRKPGGAPADSPRSLPDRLKGTARRLLRRTR